MKAARDIQIRRVPGIVSDIWDMVQAHAVLRRPAIPFDSVRICFPRKTPELVPVSAAFSSAVPAAAQKQQVIVISEGKACLRIVNVHSANVLCIFQRDHIRTVLIQLQEIASVFVEHRKMRRDDDFVRTDLSAIRYSSRTVHLPHKSVLIDIQILCDRI